MGDPRIKREAERLTLTEKWMKEARGESEETG
jgi:hypothetical protein